MPDLSANESNVTVVRWLVEVGQGVQRGRPLLEVQTDKATVEVESFVTGVLREVLVGPEGQAEVGQVIARVEKDEAVGKREAL
jgi:pyruvate/2-oxoglutarate dehydrogenase complex dihydrolipoamide acyltransferase (E2) component